MKINPISLYGPWDEGFALDLHTISSVKIGENVYGQAEYDTKYSDMGNLLHLFKYWAQHERLEEIIGLVRPFLQAWPAVADVSFVLPVPPSKPRMYQPTQEIAREVAKLLGAGYSDKILQKISSTESKGLSWEDKSQIRGTIVKTAMATKAHNTLLIDDLYKSGTTLEECVRVLRQDPKIMKIYVLVMTKTRT